MRSLRRNGQCNLQWFQSRPLVLQRHLGVPVPPTLKFTTVYPVIVEKEPSPDPPNPVTGGVGVVFGAIAWRGGEWQNRKYVSEATACLIVSQKIIPVFSKKNMASCMFCRFGFVKIYGKSNSQSEHTGSHGCSSQ